MKVATTDEMGRILALYMKQNNDSQEMLSAIYPYLNADPQTEIPFDMSELKEYAKEFRKSFPEYSFEMSMVTQMLAYFLTEAQEDSDDEEFDETKEIITAYMSDMMDYCKIYNVKSFHNNPFIRNISFKEQENEDYKLCYQYMRPYELGAYGLPERVPASIIDIVKLGCFTQKVKFPTLCPKNKEDDRLIGVDPMTIFTNESYIKNTEGKVLVLGCRMGYFAYMASLRKKVESVTIIERDTSIIDLFQSAILPSFEHKEKIKIINADPIEYLRNVEDGKFDYCFVDLCADLCDIESYLAAKEIGRQWNKTQIEYREERAFAAAIATQAMLEISRLYCHDDGEDDPLEFLFLESTDIERKVYRYACKLFENENIEIPEQFTNVLEPENIISRINQTQIIFDEA